MTLEPGAPIGDYRILAAIGAGGSGEVFRAEHVITRRIEAVKLLARGMPATQEEEQRFLREIQVQASLHHPNIAAVHNAFWTPHGLALVMELAEGEPLEAVLDRGRVRVATGASYVLQTLAALTYAHERGVVHRDVKPGNIMVAPDGQVKLTDFGLARRLEGPSLTHSGALAGSPYYMSPEQVAGLSSADARCDIYAVGVVLYEVVAGRRPFEDASAFQVMLQQRDAAPEPPLHLNPEIGPELNGVILTAMAKDPAERYQSAAEFRAALEAALGIEPPTRAPAPACASRSGRRRRRWVVAAAALVCLAGGIALLSRQPPPAPPPLVPSAPDLAMEIATPAEPEAPPSAAVVPPAVEPPPSRRLARPKMFPPAPETPPEREPYSAAPAAPEPEPSRAEAAPEADPPQAAGPAVAAGKTQAPEAARAKKKRHVVWRTLGRVVRPGSKPAQEQPPPPGRPAAPE